MRLMSGPMNPDTGLPAAGQPTRQAPSKRSPAAFSEEVRLGQYRLYAQTTELAADRRATANRFYLAVHTSLIAALAIVGGYGVFTFNGAPPAQSSMFLTQVQPLLVLTLGLVGVTLAFVWRGTIRSFRILQTAKFEVIHEMEEWLPFQAFENEGLKLRAARYPEATRLELRLPWLSLVLYVALLIAYAYFDVIEPVLPQVPFLR